MKDGDSIILNGSIADIKGFPAMSVYSATKAAVRSFARTWTNDLRDRRIRVNVLSPGHIDTPILEDLQQGEALLKMTRRWRATSHSEDWGTPTRLPKLFHSWLPMRRAMSRAQSFTSMVAWRKSECCKS
jgi:NAD(P)-dependent dehydrogenase (short-subunit alcohol dehydrogenase family)